jgi:hypothetical protein
VLKFPHDVIESVEAPPNYAAFAKLLDEMTDEATK